MEFKRSFKKTNDSSRIHNFASSKKICNKDNKIDYILANDFLCYSKNEKYYDHREQFDFIYMNRPVDARFDAKSTGLVIRGEY